MDSPVVSSAFPSWRFLCHLWPIRAIERISFSEPQEQEPVQETLVLLRKLDPWNYPRVSETAARELWPDAHVFSDLDFGVSPSSLDQIMSLLTGHSPMLIAIYV